MKRILIFAAAAAITMMALPLYAADNTPELGRVDSEHFILKARADDLKLLKDPAGWLANLDRVYEAYADLVGSTPYNGERITILATQEDVGGWAVAGNPILWARSCFLESIPSMNKGNWVFGIMHEIGHDFDLDYRWNWQAELLANFKLDYAAERSKAVIHVYGRDEICDYGEPNGLKMTDIYRISDTERGTYGVIRTGAYDEDQCHRKLSEFVSEVGWEPIKGIFGWYNGLSPEEMTADPLARRSIFIRGIEDLSGTKVVDRFINWGFSYIDVDAKNMTEAGRILHKKNWHADVANRPIETTPDTKVTIAVTVAEQDPIAFKKGLGTHAESEYVYNLGGRYKTFDSYVGIPGYDPAENRWGEVAFEVVADGKKVYESPALIGGGTYKHVVLDVADVKELKLLTKRNGEAAWGGAKVTDAQGDVTYLSDLKPVSIKCEDWVIPHFDRTISDEPLMFCYGPCSKPVKITGMIDDGGSIDSKSFTLREGREPGTYEYEFDGFVKGTHRMHLIIKVGDEPITQHEFVRVIVK